MDSINEPHGNNQNAVSSVINKPNSSSSSKICRNGKCETKTCTNGICKTVIVHSTQHLLQNHPPAHGIKETNDVTVPGHSEVSEIRSDGYGKDPSLPPNSALMSSTSSKVCKDGKCETKTCNNGVCKTVTVYSTKHVSQIQPASHGIKTTNNEAFYSIPGQSQVSVITSNDNNLDRTAPLVNALHSSSSSKVCKNGKCETKTCKNGNCKTVTVYSKKQISQIHPTFHGREAQNDTGFHPAPEISNDTIITIEENKHNIATPSNDKEKALLSPNVDETDVTTFDPDHEHSDIYSIRSFGNDQNTPVPSLDPSKSSSSSKHCKNGKCVTKTCENGVCKTITTHSTKHFSPINSTTHGIDGTSDIAFHSAPEMANNSITIMNGKNPNISGSLTDTPQTSLSAQLDETDATEFAPDEENTNNSIITINGINQNISAPLTDKQIAPLSPKVGETDVTTFDPDQKNSNISIITINRNNQNILAPLSDEQKPPLSPEVDVTNVTAIGTDNKNSDIFSVMKSYGLIHGPSVPLNNPTKSFSSSSKICKNGKCETKTCKNGVCKRVSVLSAKHQSHEHPTLQEIKETNSGANVHHDNLQRNNLLKDSSQSIMIHNTHQDSGTLPAHGESNVSTKIQADPNQRLLSPKHSQLSSSSYSCKDGKCETKTCKNGKCNVKTTLMKGTGSNSEPSNLLDNKTFSMSQASAPSSLPLQNTGHATGYSYSCVNGVCSNKTWTEPKELSQMASHN